MLKRIFFVLLSKKAYWIIILYNITIETAFFVLLLRRYSSANVLCNLCLLCFSFKPPGRLAAGMSCEMQAIFQPTVSNTSPTRLLNGSVVPRISCKLYKYHSHLIMTLWQLHSTWLHCLDHYFNFSVDKLYIIDMYIPLIRYQLFHTLWNNWSSVV